MTCTKVALVNKMKKFNYQIIDKYFELVGQKFILKNFANFTQIF